MVHITVATFISNKEKFRLSLVETLNYLRGFGIDYELIVFSDKPFESDNPKIRREIDGGETKYKRILRLFALAANDLVFCVDNDIMLNNENFKDFVLECNSANYIAGWGKIAALPCKGLTANLIKIDKNISHNFLRPLLWKAKLGISLPGQVFMFRKSVLKISGVNTLFDDLQIGIAIKKSNEPIFYSNDILGLETPKANLKLLVRQRIRWAQGYAEVLLLNKKSLSLILIHGLAWHFWWILFWGIVVACCYFDCQPAAFLFIQIVIMLISRNQISDYKFAALYLLIFPILHIIWGNFVLLKLFKEIFWEEFS